jgi:ATP-binding cassette subfamily F protein 3
VETRAAKRALDTAFAKKQEAARKHMQAFVDRFRYKASKARQAQSRIKMLAKHEDGRHPAGRACRAHPPAEARRKRARR